MTCSLAGRGGRIGGARVSRGRVFEPMVESNQGLIKMYTWCLALLGWNKDWLAQCQDNLTGMSAWFSSEAAL